MNEGCTMITFQIFLSGLLLVSIITSLTTEGVKKLFVEHNKKYYANTLAGVISVIISIGVGVGYVLLTGIGFNAQTIVYLVALAFMSWVCSMVGYDKVVQTFAQFKTTREDE